MDECVVPVRAGGGGISVVLFAALCVPVLPYELGWVGLGWVVVFSAQFVLVLGWGHQHTRESGGSFVTSVSTCAVFSARAGR